MSDRKPWNLDSTHSLEGFAEFVRKRSDAAVVLIVRGRDFAMAAAPGICGADARTAVEFVLPSAVEVAGAKEKERREAATRRRAQQIVSQARRAE